MNVLALLLFIILLPFVIWFFKRFLHWSTNGLSQGIVSEESNMANLPSSLSSGEANSLAKDPGNSRPPDAFEAFVANLFCRTPGRFLLLEWRVEEPTGEAGYNEERRQPAFEMVVLNGRKKHRFTVACKWQPQFRYGVVEWASERQIRHYQKYQKVARRPFFVAIGVGGTPAQPADVYLAPLEAIAPFPNIFELHLRPFYCNPALPFTFNPNDKVLVQ